MVEILQLTYELLYVFFYFRGPKSASTMEVWGLKSSGRPIQKWYTNSAKVYDII